MCLFQYLMEYETIKTTNPSNTYDMSTHMDFHYRHPDMAFKMQKRCIVFLSVKEVYGFFIEMLGPISEFPPRIPFLTNVWIDIANKFGKKFYLTAFHPTSLHSCLQIMTMLLTHGET